MRDAGLLGDAGIAGQAVHAAALAEPAQDQHGLASAALGTRTAPDRPVPFPRPSRPTPASTPDRDFGLVD
jgi:hypothetical protein